MCESQNIPRNTYCFSKDKVMREREVAGVENRKGLETSVVRVSNPLSMVYDGEVVLFVQSLDVSKFVCLE